MALQPKPKGYGPKDRYLPPGFAIGRVRWTPEDDARFVEKNRKYKEQWKDWVPSEDTGKEGIRPMLDSSGKPGLTRLDTYIDPELQAYRRRVMDSCRSAGWTQWEMKELYDTMNTPEWGEMIAGQGRGV